MFSSWKLIGIFALLSSVLAGLLVSLFLYWKLRTLKAENAVLKKNIEAVERTMTEERRLEAEAKRKQRENTQRIQAAMARIGDDNVVSELNQLYSN